MKLATGLEISNASQICTQNPSNAGDNASHGTVSVQIGGDLAI